MSQPRIAVAYDCLYPINTGGGERVYRRIAELLVESGAEVTYITRRQWTDAADRPHAVFDIATVWHGEIHDASGTRTLRSAIGFAFGLFRHLIARRRDYDIVMVSALPVLNVIATAIALAGSGVFVVVDWLEVWPLRKYREYSGAIAGTIAFVLQWLGLRVGALRTVNSAFTRERARRYRRRDEPIVLGLLDLIAEGSGGASAASDRPYALFAGRHIPDKQLVELPAAIAWARRELPTLECVIAGDGPDTDEVRRRIAALGLDGVVQVVGRVDDADLVRLMAGASVLVNPSRREGFGLVVAEAASVGTPSVVVAGDDNAAAELVVDGRNGFVASSTAPADLGGAIVDAVRRGDALRASTSAWFSSERTTRNLRASVDEVLARYRASKAR